MFFFLGGGKVWYVPGDKWLEWGGVRIMVWNSWKFHLCQGGNVLPIVWIFVFVCVLATLCKTTDWIFMKILPKMYFWTRKLPLNESYPDLDQDSWIFNGIYTTVELCPTLQQWMCLTMCLFNSNNVAGSASCLGSGLYSPSALVKGNLNHCGIEVVVHILLITQDIVDKYLWNASKWPGCLTGNKPFDFGADPHHDHDSGIFNGILTLLERGNCKHFAGSVGLAEVCGVRLLLVNSSFLI